MVGNQKDLCRFPYLNNAILQPSKIKLALDANGSTALDMALLNESYDLIELIFAAVPSELYREDAEGMSVLAICFCRPMERWLGILKRRKLECDDYIYQLLKSAGWFSKLQVKVDLQTEPLVT